MKNTQLQQFQYEIEHSSNELDKINPKNWNISDRLRLSQYWNDLQRKFDDQSIDFIYKSNSSTINRSYLGELYVQTFKQDNEYLQVQNVNSYDNQSSLIPMVKFKKTHHTSSRYYDDYPIKLSSSTSREDDINQENMKYSSRRKLIRTYDQQQSSINRKLSNENEQDNIPLTPRMPISSIQLKDYSKKATHILTGPNEADKFLSPKAIAMTNTNQLLIADTKKHRIIIYDLNLKTMRGIKGFLFPDGLCLSTEHYVIITDRHRISKYDWLNSKMISFIGSKKEGCTRSSFSWPKGVVIDKNYVYVCDSYNSRIVVLTHQMHYENEWIIMRGKNKKHSS